MFLFIHMLIGKSSNIMSETEELPDLNEVTANYNNDDLGVWPNNLDTDFLIAEMKTLKKEKCHANKGFYVSYPKWNLMTVDQRNKSIAFFNLQTIPIKAAVSALKRLLKNK